MWHWEHQALISRRTGRWIARGSRTSCQGTTKLKTPAIWRIVTSIAMSRDGYRAGSDEQGDKGAESASSPADAAPPARSLPNLPNLQTKSSIIDGALAEFFISALAPNVVSCRASGEDARCRSATWQADADAWHAAAPLSPPVCSSPTLGVSCCRRNKHAPASARLTSVVLQGAMCFAACPASKCGGRVCRHSRARAREQGITPSAPSQPGRRDPHMRADRQSQAFTGTSMGIAERRDHAAAMTKPSRDAAGPPFVSDTSGRQAFLKRFARPAWRTHSSSYSRPHCFLNCWTRLLAIVRDS